MQWRKIILVAIAASAVAGTVHADLMPLLPSGAAGQAWSSIDEPARDPQDVRHEAPLPIFDFVNLGTLGAGPLPMVDAEDIEQSAEIPPARIASDRQNSLDLCLYALLGLGLCRSAPLMRRFTWGVIPEWYHDGGPLQVGHSHAVGPDCLCCSPNYCFIQPAGTAEDPPPDYRRQATFALWRESQFIPTVLAARGPPRNSQLR